jgi:hypothetical protein
VDKYTFTKQAEKVCLPARKLMATVFWDRKEVLMVGFMQQGTTIIAEVYCRTLKKIAEGHSDQRCGMLTFSLVLLHDNAC